MRTLWIPIAGTIAALVAVLLAHGARGPADVAPSGIFDPGEIQDPPEPPEPPSEPPAPEVKEWRLILQPDGSFLTDSGDESFANAEELLERLAPTDSYRPRILLTNAAEKVTEEALDVAAAALSARCDLTKRYYRAPEPEKEG